ncbi:GNAT family N-acetyltransferase [Haloarchaeobius sp. DYHT-AS-18]|uniref:GNAT family N-acetyltransferase n=1 Tax=Haloarchaeobius sp. DYHT-AS-18 TaxID=3446117 RepID=UPI003EB935A1
MTSDAVAAANANMAAAFARLSDHTPTGSSRTVGELTAITTGVPVPFFNPVFVFEPPARDDLSRAVSWMAEQDVPFRVTVAEPAVDATNSLAADLGLERTGDPQPGMVLASLDEIPRADDLVDIEVVTDAGGLDAFVAVTAAAFGMPEPVARQVAPESMLADETIEILVGRVDGDPAASGLLVRSGDVAGVYNIGVTEAFRRRGVGEAMTWAVLRAGREAGGTVGALQSSEMGYSVYERMGFETVVTYHSFSPV